MSLVFDFASRGADKIVGDFTKTGSSAALASKNVRLCADALDRQERAGKAAASGLQTAERVSALLAVTEHELDKEIEKANRALVTQGIAAKAAGKGAADARGGFAGLVGEITGFGAASAAASSKSTLFARALAGINLASGVLEPALAGLVVTAGGLAAGFAAAGAGLGVFGLVAKSVFTEASKAATAYAAAQAKYDVATTSKQRAAALQAEKNAFAGLSPPAKALAIELGNLKSQWKAFTAAAAPGVVGVLSQGIGILSDHFGLLKPFLAPTEAALSGILAKLNTGLNSAGFKSFLDLLAKNTGPAITKIATAIGNVVVGIGGILRAFMPTSQVMLTGIDKITAKFREWGTTLSSHTGFQSLMTTFREETPQAVAILKNLGTVLVNVGKAMFGLSTFSNSKMLLQALLPLSGVMASLSRNTDLVRVAMYALAAVKIGQQFSWVGDAWKGIVKFAAVTEGATVAETIAAAATRAWGLAMDALPWVALAAAVIAVAVLIIKYHTQIWHFIQRVWHDILAVIMGVWHWIQANWPLLLGIITGPVGLAILWIVQHFGTITTAVKTVLSAVATAWNATWNTLKTAFRALVVDWILTPLGWIIHGAATAFGWMGPLGGKLKTAARAFDQFKADVNRSLGGINGRTVSVNVNFQQGGAATAQTGRQTVGGHVAAGGRITGPGGPTSDTAGLFALSNGEWVIRADSASRYGLTAMDAVNRGKAVIGYASGGGVGVAVSKPGSAAIESALMGPLTKLAIAFAKAAVAAAAASGGAGVPGPGGGAPAANAALARKLMPAWASGAEWNAWNYLEMREAGWNQYARNPSSGAYGIPQALPPSKMGAAANPPQSNPAAQIRWMTGYIQGRYRDPIGAAAHERAYSWYDRGGWLKPGWNPPMYNGTGAMEHLTPDSGLAGLAAELRALRRQMAELIRTTAAVPAATGRHVAGAVGGAGADAAFRRRYPQGGW